MAKVGEGIIKVIGIDPGVHTGLAVYSRLTKKIVFVENLDFWSCYDKMNLFVRETTLVIIEAPLKNIMYARQEKAAEQGSMRRSNAMMSGAAGNAREAELLADGIERLGFEVRRVRPTRRNFKKAEDDVAHIKRLTGFEGRTNPHTRDAIMLAYNT